MKAAPDETPRDQNADPITGEPGAHPVATGVGAAAAGAAGLAIATAVAGPIGVAAAVVGGAIAGGYAGKAAGELIDPTAEDAYWKEQHPRQTYASQGGTFEDYHPAYRTGYEGYSAHGLRGGTFEEAEAELRADYERRGARLPWEHGREAARAAWARAQFQGGKTQADPAGQPRVDSPGARDDTGLIV